jgi:hypothetical protein
MPLDSLSFAPDIEHGSLAIPEPLLPDALERSARRR